MGSLARKARRKQERAALRAMNAAPARKPAAVQRVENSRRYIASVMFGAPMGRNVQFILTPFRFAVGVDVSMILDGARLYFGFLTIAVAWRAFPRNG